MDYEEVKKEILSMASEGMLLPKCPHCDMLLDIKEPLNGQCDSCKEEINVDTVLWLSTDTFPEA